MSSDNIISYAKKRRAVPAKLSEEKGNVERYFSENCVRRNRVNNFFITDEDNRNYIKMYLSVDALQSKNIGNY